MRSDLPNEEEVTQVLRKFRDFLNASWPVINDLLQSHDWDNDPYFLEDWIDENWKQLVARQLLGKNADLQPFAISTNDIMKKKHKFQIRCESPLDGLFVSLGAGENEFLLGHPFDKVKILTDQGSLETVTFSKVRFKICEAHKTC